MELNIKFDISIDDSIKILQLTDYSTGINPEHFYKVENVNVTSEIGVWSDKIDIDLGYEDITILDGKVVGDYVYYESGCTINISKDKLGLSDFVYDDLYTVSITLRELNEDEDNLDPQDETAGVYESTTFAEVLSGLSKYFTSDYTLSYNYFEPNVQKEEMIIRYNTWLIMLPILAEFSDNNRISEILNIFKKLVTAYGLPE